MTTDNPDVIQVKITAPLVSGQHRINAMALEASCAIVVTPDDARRHLEGRTMTADTTKTDWPGHEDDGSGEPTRFAWFRDGEMIAGTLSDWVKMWEGDYYAGENDLSSTLLTWDGEPGTARYHKVAVARGAVTEDDFIPHTFTVSGLHDVVSCSIDGRN